jgi:hypothetical protein
MRDRRQIGVNWSRAVLFSLLDMIRVFAFLEGDGFSFRDQ